MRARSRNRHLSQGEEELWRRVVARVEPLKNRATPAAAPDEKPPAPAEPAFGHSAYTEIDPLPPADPREKPGSKVYQRPAQTALDRRTALRLQRGQLAIEGRLDLHGMTQKQAYPALLRFIRASRSFDRRLVLVVTGKGWNPEADRPEEAIGILRRSVPRWLDSQPFTEHVAAVTDAHLKHGGSGALYVMLRRSRRL